MSEKIFLDLGQKRIELIVPDSGRDLRYSPDNNVNSYGVQGELLWNISDLLRKYSDQRGFQYYNDMYFEIRVLDDNRIFCVGFCNHCIIDLSCDEIIQIINNR